MLYYSKEALIRANSAVLTGRTVWKKINNEHFIVKIKGINSPLEKYKSYIQCFMVIGLILAVAVFIQYYKSSWTIVAVSILGILISTYILLYTSWGSFKRILTGVPKKYYEAFRKITLIALECGALENTERGIKSPAFYLVHFCSNGLLEVTMATTSSGFDFFRVIDDFNGDLEYKFGGSFCISTQPFEDGKNFWAKFTMTHGAL